MRGCKAHTVCMRLVLATNCGTFIAAIVAIADAVAHAFTRNASSQRASVATAV